MKNSIRRATRSSLTSTRWGTRKASRAPNSGSSRRKTSSGALLIRDGNLSAGDAGSVFEEILFNNHGESFRAELHRQMGRKHTYTIDEIFDVAKEYVKYDKKRRFFSPELASLVAGRGETTAAVSHLAAREPSGYPSELSAALARRQTEQSVSAMTLQATYAPAPAAAAQAPAQPDVMQQILLTLQTLVATGQQQNGAQGQAPRGNRQGQRGAGWDQNGEMRCFLRAAGAFEMRTATSCSPTGTVSSRHRT